MPSAQSCVYRERRSEHGVNPTFFHETIERVYPGLPKSEMFAGHARPGCCAWGNEVKQPHEFTAYEDGTTGEWNGRGHGQGLVFAIVEQMSASERDPAIAETLGYNGFPRGEPVMVKHGALSKSHVYHLLRSKDARVRHAAFTLLERAILRSEQIVAFL